MQQIIYKHDFKHTPPLVLGNLNPLPKCNIVFDIFGFFACAGIVLCSIIRLLPISLNRVITGFTFPGAQSMRITFNKILLIYVIRWEVMVVFYYNGITAFCNNFSVKYGFIGSVFVLCAIKSCFF